MSLRFTALAAVLAVSATLGWACVGGAPGATTASANDAAAASPDASAVDAATGGEGGSDGQGGGPLRVFVTSEEFMADLGGLEGADAKCTAAAQTIAPPTRGRWVAWLSDDSHAAVQRVITPARGRAFARLDDALVVARAEDLTAGLLLAPINVNEMGKSIASSSVWTGTLANALADASNCAGWRNAGGSNEKGKRGTAGEVSGSWTDDDRVDGCGAANHLYCFELPLP